MGKYVIRRLLQAIPMLLVISILLFLLVNLTPGGPMAGHGRRGRGRLNARKSWRRQFGLDQPILEAVYLLVSGE